MKIIIETNTRGKWVEAQGEVYKKLSLSKAFEQIDFVLTLNTKKFNLEESDVTNLRYYFPLCNSLQKENYTCSLTINIDKSQKYYDDIYYRVISFLKFLTEPDSIRKTIYINQTKLEQCPQINKIEPSDIFPIMVTDLGKINFDVLKIINNKKIESLINPTIREICKTRLTINKYDFESNILANTIALVLLENMLKEENDLVLANSYQDCIDRCILSARTYADGIYQIIENACFHSEGKKAFWGFRVHKADKNAPMSKYEKETQTRVRLYEKYKWCFTNHYPPENSAKEGKMRNIADADISARIFGNSKYKYFLEIFVLDDAVQQIEKINSTRDVDKIFESQGIVSKIRNQNNLILDAKQTIFCIEDILLLKEENYKDTSSYYIEHYGLRWFDKVIKKNDGLYYIITPQNNKTSTYYSHKKFDPHHQCEITSINQWLRKLTVPIHFAERVDEFLKYQNFNVYNFLASYCYPSKELDSVAYSTEYNILLPISETMIVEDDIDKVNLNIFNYKEKEILKWDAALETTDKMLKSMNLTSLEIDNADLIKSNITNTAASKKNFKIELVEKLIQNILITSPKENYQYADIEVKRILDLFSKFNIDINIEILAKALFLSVYNLRQNGIDKELLFELDFEDLGNNSKDEMEPIMMLEFVRVFSIVYNKIGENKYMNLVQIAICYDDNNEKKVGLVLAGETLKSAYKSARAQLYYNGADAIPFLSAVKDLADDDSNYATIPSSSTLYPFDIRLVDGKYINSDSNGYKNLFLNRIERILEKDYQNKDYGCKIKNTHIRISSRIHLTEFYEAELLFHSISNVYKFAELLADDIQNEILADAKSNDKKNILLVGYEKYSSSLILRLQEVLKRREIDMNRKIDAAIVLKSGDSSVLDEHCEVYWFKPIDREGRGQIIVPTISDKYDLYSIVPIGSTMSTIYKIQDIIRNYLSAHFVQNIQKKTQSSLVDNDNANKIDAQDNWEHLDKIHNYVLLAVLPDKNSEKIGRRYLDMNPQPTTGLFSQYAIKPRNKNNIGQMVKCLLIERAAWHAADKCEICAKERLPLITVDKTSTLPKVIFEETEDKFRQSFENNNELDLQPNMVIAHNGHLACESFLTYGHIIKGESHYQFYFNFDGMVQKQKDTIEKWAKNEGELIDKKAFNIVVSPLSESNSVFLKIILDNVFESTARFLHIDIGMYKEDVRAKFSYIAHEIKQIKLNNPLSKINFYFVDNSTSQGLLLQRSKMLMQLLLSQAQLSERQRVGIELYKRIFLFVNRSSYDTLKLFLKNPLTDCRSFYNVLFPAFNMKAGECPICKLQKRYKILLKRASTVEIARAFSHFVHKHKKRTLEEYDEWLSNEILDNHSYLGWLKLWLISSGGSKTNDKKIDEIIGQIEKKIKDDASTKYSNVVNGKSVKGLYESSSNTESDHVQNYLREINKVTIRQLFDNENNMQTDVVELVKYIVSKRACIRFDALQESYKMLMVEIWNDKQQQSNQDYDLIEKTKSAIWELLCKKLSKNMTKDKIYDDFEWLESCVKAICREQLVNYYRVRQAVFNVLQELLEILINKQDRDPNNNSLCKKIIREHVHSDNEQRSKKGNMRSVPIMCQYNLFSAITHGLASLHCFYVLGLDEKRRLIDGENKPLDYDQIYKDVFLKFCKLTSSNDFLQECPSQQDVIISRIVAIKTVAMLEDDDAQCFRLTDAINMKERQNESK